MRRARADQKERACQEVACAELSCIGALKREIDDQAQAIRDRRAGERRELVASLRQHLASLGDKAPAGALLALASTMDDMAREETDGDVADLSPRLKEPIALYERAAALSGPAAAHERAGEREAAAALRARGPRLPPGVMLPPVAVGAAAERSEMEGRLAALVRRCGETHPMPEAPLELVVTVDAAGPRPARVTVRPAKAGPPSDFMRCLEARGPGYFVDAPALLRAALTLTRAF